MTFPRTSGILLHPTSLPSRHGIGDLGPAARRFVDWLAAAGQSLWQVLPLGPTGYGDSPYQAFSAFAGNTALISLEDLVGDGWLAPGDLTAPDLMAVGAADVSAALAFKMPRLQEAFARFEADATPELHAAFARFLAGNAAWLPHYALFRAVKAAHDGKPWPEWEPAIAHRTASALAGWSERCQHAVRAEQFAQWQFHVQWERLHARCRAARIHVMGDVPIFVAHDSADVWTHPDLFWLHADGQPQVVAGVPPDYFSDTGQCWGNPLYRWDVMRQEGYRWWVDRFRHTLAVVDWVRVDHFRGFEAYWEIPGGETTAVNGRWVKGPGEGLFEVVQRELGDLPIAAENLGLITPEVEAMRRHLGFPGMAVLQFAFGGDLQASGFLPHNFERDLVAYTGTHDNDTVVGWWNSSGAADSTRSPAEVAAEKAFVRRYLDFDGEDIHWRMIRALLGSVARVAVVPLQDVLGLGSEARMNLPARPSGNWTWRYDNENLTPALAARVRELTVLFGRFPSREEE